VITSRRLSVVERLERKAHALQDWSYCSILRLKMLKMTAPDNGPILTLAAISRLM
jgi:hypothetical protein